SALAVCACSACAEDSGQLQCGDFFELVVPAGLGVLVGTPAEEVRRVAEAVTLQVIVGDLADALGTEGFPAQVLPAVPPTRSAGHALIAFLDAGPVAPGMVFDRVLSERSQLVHQLAAFCGGKAGGDADVVQLAFVIVEP